MTNTYVYHKQWRPCNNVLYNGAAEDISGVTEHEGRFRTIMKCANKNLKSKIIGQVYLAEADDTALLRKKRTDVNLRTR